MMNEVNNEFSFTIDQIMTMLPHRYPMLLIDRVLNYVPNTSLHGIKNITFNEPVFTGHFPQKPIFPGVLILEALAQATGLLGHTMIDKVEDSELYLLASINNAKFKAPVTPGDTLHLHATFLRERKKMWKFSTEARVEGKLVCSADIMCARREI